MARARQFREWEATADADWLRMSGEADRWRRFPRRHRARLSDASQADTGTTAAPTSASAALPDITA